MTYKEEAIENIARLTVAMESIEESRNWMIDVGKSVSDIEPKLSGDGEGDNTYRLKAIALLLAVEIGVLSRNLSEFDEATS